MGVHWNLICTVNCHDLFPVSDNERPPSYYTVFLIMLVLKQNILNNQYHVFPYISLFYIPWPVIRRRILCMMKTDSLFLNQVHFEDTVDLMGYKFIKILKIQKESIWQSIGVVIIFDMKHISYYW